MSRKKDILTALRDLNDQDLRTAGAALFDALGYRSTRTFEDLPTDPTSFWDFFSQGHSDLDPGKAEIERWRGATFLFQLTDAEVHDLAQAREATKEQGDYEESEIESFLFLAIDLEGEQWTRTRLAQITRTLNRLFLMPAIVLFRHGGMASLAVIDRRQSKVDAAKDVILAKKIAIIKDIRLAKPHRAHIDILEKLTFANLNRGRNITTFRALYDAWLAACSVETLTKEFFTKLSELFFDTSDSVATRFPDENERRLFVQTLFNRLIFLRFVEEKGWMKIDGRYDYLQALWEKACDSNQPLWPTRLNALFGAVNHPISDKVHEVAKPIIGTVPYLNGGLFEDDSRFADPTVQFPDVIFDRLVGPEGLLYRYLFTVEESTPLDVQVAVDPEILGKIFEQLTISSKRHDTGSYYTPREIVQFMCREALVGYLTSPRPSGGEGSGVRGLPEAKARALVYDHDDSTLTNQEGNLAFEALKAIKVVDPACGSGAYLLGMLQELYALFEKLRRDDRKFSDDPAKEAHERKLWIIENNIYGVDLQAFATNTAMLRLWLTLLVEDTGERPQPLPNLEYKIETGDSLLGPDPSQPIGADILPTLNKSGSFDFEGKGDLIQELRDLRKKYQKAHAKEKNDIKGKLEPKLRELRKAVTGSAEKDEKPFDWRVEFFDVFLDDPNSRPPGFDAVAMNPPYITANRLPGDQREAFAIYMEKVKEVFGYKADLYILFLERALDLLNPGGVLAAITSNTFFTNTTKLAIRKLLLDNQLQWLIPLGPDVFDADVYSAISVVQKTLGADEDAIGYVNLRKENLQAVANVEALRRAANVATVGDYRRALSNLFYEPSAENKALFETLLSATDIVSLNGAEFIPLELVAPALDTGVHSGNVRTRLFYAEPPEGRTLPRMLQGTQIVRYGSWWASPRARFRYVDVDYEADPDVAGVGRGGRPSGRGEYWHFCGPIENHHVEERLLMRQTEDEPFIGYIHQGEERVYTDNTLHTLLLTPLGKSLGLSLKYLMAILNSAKLREIYQAIVQEDGRALAQVKTTLVNRLPIRMALPEDKSALEAFVAEIMAIHESAGFPLSDDAEARIADIQAQIDERVDFLYNIHQGAFTYDEWLAKQGAETGTIIEEIRKLLAIGHETDRFECKSSFSWDVKKGEYADWLKDEVHTAICALLNAKGGDLLVGVEDDMNILGLAEDLERYGNRDKLIQAIEGPLGKTLSPNPIGLVDIKPVDLDGQTILRIQVKPDNAERYQFKDQIYVRRNSKSKPALTPAEAASWWPKRQRGEV